MSQCNNQPELILLLLQSLTETKAVGEPEAMRVAAAMTCQQTGPVVRFLFRERGPVLIEAGRGK